MIAETHPMPIMARLLVFITVPRNPNKALKIGHVRRSMRQKTAAQGE